MLDEAVLDEAIFDEAIFDEAIFDEAVIVWRTKPKEIESPACHDKFVIQ